MINDYIEQHGKRLYGLCITLCGNSVEADDLYQDTWLKVVGHISNYDVSKEFEPWLTQICVNTYRNRLRRLAKSPIWDRFHNNEEKESAINAVHSPTPKDYSTLHEAIKRLPEKYRITIVLFYFEDMDIKSTAQALSIPIGTVKSRLDKSKKLLKEVLKGEADISF